jgi:predicted transcriptional regulator
MKSLEESRPMNRHTKMNRILLITLLLGFILVSFGALTSASALPSMNVKLDTDRTTLEDKHPSGLLGTVDGIKDDATGLVHDTTGVDVDNVAAAADDATAMLPNTDGVTGSTPQSSAASSEPRPLTSKEATTAGVMAAATTAGLLLWMQNVLGIGIGRLFMAPLFSRIDKDELLDNEARDLLVTLVDENPGIGLKEISERAGLGWGTTVYHMSRLESAGFVASLKNGQHRHFFKNGHPAALMKKHVAVLRNETAGNMARFLLATPGSTQTTIAKRLGLGAPTVTKYVKRMESQGLVEVVQDGRSKIVQPTMALQNALDHAAPAMPEVPRHAGLLGDRPTPLGVA